MTQCLECGTAMRTRKGAFRYRDCGLEHVTLMAHETRHCPRCGRIEPAIPRLEALDARIEQALVLKSVRLAGDEVRFLRNRLRWSGAEFARHMGVAVETVSRWETGAIPIGPQADRLLRLLVAQSHPAARFPAAHLAAIDPANAEPLRLTLRFRADRWELVAS